MNGFPILPSPFSHVGVPFSAFVTLVPFRCEIPNAFEMRFVLVSFRPLAEMVAAVPSGFNKDKIVEVVVERVFVSMVDLITVRDRPVGVLPLVAVQKSSAGAGALKIRSKMQVLTFWIPAIARARIYDHFGCHVCLSC